MHKRVSVVIPIFNAGKYIGETLKSVIEQSYNNLEIILIDDGSTDDTLSIIKEFIDLNKDNRLFLYEKSNAGVSSARNFGLKKSSGYFVFFLDSDDIIESDFIYELIRAYDRNRFSHIVSAKNIYDYHSDGYYKKWRCPTVKEIYYSREFVYVWGKLYLRDFLVKNNIEFDNRLIVGEDFYFNSRCAFYGARFCFVENDSKFLYRIHSGSLSNNIKLVMERFQSSFLIYKTISMIEAKSNVAITVYLKGFLLLLLKLSIKKRDFVLFNRVCEISFSSKEINVTPAVIMKSDLSIKEKVFLIMSFYYYGLVRLL